MSVYLFVCLCFSDKQIFSIFDVGRALPKEEVIIVWERYASYSGYKNTKFL